VKTLFTITILLLPVIGWSQAPPPPAVPPSASIPEPETFALLGAGAIAALFARRKQK
jgi:hypothetical protein